MPSEWAEYLHENGPSTVEDAPFSSGPTVQARQEGARRLYPNVTTGSAAVWYLPEHDTREVIREWLEANEAAVAGCTGRKLIRALNDAGSEFADVSTEVVRNVAGKQWKPTGGGTEQDKDHYMSAKDWGQDE